MFEMTFINLFTTFNVNCLKKSNGNKQLKRNTKWKTKKTKRKTNFLH